MRNKAYIIVLAILLLVGVTACGNANENKNSGGNTSGTEADASTLYQQNCAACHGNNLQGKNGPNLQKIGSELSKEQILKQIKNGGGGMPGNILSGEDADKVATWLAGKK